LDVTSITFAFDVFFLLHTEQNNENVNFLLGTQILCWSYTVETGNSHIIH